MVGEPCIRGLRIPVATVVGPVAQDLTREQILDYYPDLEPDDIREALAYTAESLVPPLLGSAWTEIVPLSNDDP